MSLNVYLYFNGNCEEAMNFYKNATGGTIDSMQQYGDSPMGADIADKDKVLHAVMTIYGTKVMFSDSNAKRHINFGDNFSLALDFKSGDTIKNAFEALSAGGAITMPLQDTFWGATFGMCTDKYGINWMFNFDKPKS
jgi:PhnB protein